MKHLDETGFRVAGRGQWRHGLSHQLLTYYRISERRGGVLSGLRGILVHDHWAPYFQVPDGLHALWNSHHLEASVKIDGEAWAGRVQRLLQRGNRRVEDGGGDGVHNHQSMPVQSEVAADGFRSPLSTHIRLPESCAVTEHRWIGPKSE